MNSNPCEPVRIIVVDDEPISADELGELIADEFAAYGVETRVAYNAATVLAMTETCPCDILVSDIQMPGMSGLTLAKELRKKFPDMCILFLTGFDDFAYAYEAFRQNAAHYLLKTEGDEAILRAIRGVIERLLGRRRMISRIHEAEDRYIQMMPAYRRQLLTQLLLGAPQDDHWDELEGLFPGGIYLVVARLEEGDGILPMRSKLIALSSVEEIIDDAVGKGLSWSETATLDDELVWLFAMRDDAQYTGTLFQLARKARGHLEEQLSMQLFFVVADEPVEIRRLGEKYAEIRTMLAHQILHGTAGAAIRHPLDVVAPMDKEQARRMSLLRRQIELCEKDAKAGSFDILKVHAQPVLKYIRETQGTADLCAVEFAASLEGLLLGYINQNGLTSSLELNDALRRQGDAPARIEALVDSLVEKSKEQIDHAMRSIVQFVLDYIREHISEDISTSALAEAAGYSAGYLSRIFKQQEGISIHDYVTMTRMNLARELLCNTNLRVYEIASSCGYDNTAYFIRVFKNHTGLTPQEYKQDTIQRGRRSK